ncbi:MAG: protease inhibitor I9 family protein, partial [Nocardioidaceae bacterium]
MSTLRRFTLAAAAACTLVLGASGLTATAAPTPATATATATATGAGAYIVVLDDGSSARDVAAQHAARFGLDVGHVYSSALDGYSARMPDSVAALVEASPSVAWVQEDTPVATTAQTTPTGINRADAELSPTARING